jgi:p-hydroxybenzoate 3-monooxygenase
MVVWLIEANQDIGTGRCVALLEVDIGIIGSGIAGASLAAALADTGLSVALLDRRNEPLDTARGDHIQPAVQPLLARWGVLEAMLAAGAEYRAGTRWFDAKGSHLLTVPVPQIEGGVSGFLFLNHEKIGQVLLDRACQSGAASLAGISQWQVERAGQGWRIDWHSDGASGGVRCTLLVGADGTASSLRHHFDISLERHRYQYPITVLYGRQRALPDARTLDVYLCRERMVSMIPRTGGGTKVGFPVAPEEITFWRNEREDRLQDRLYEWCPSAEFDFLAFGAIYPPVSQKSAAYLGEGAMTLIGDARHAMHPARSMGMNTCFRVADQLAGLLSELPPGFTEEAVKPLLKRFDLDFEAELMPRLAENHAAGLQMDTIEGGGFPELVEQLQQVAENPNMRRAMALKAAGIAV